jgi:hypothetical protein
MYLSEDQLVSGQKTFVDKCHISKRVNVHSIIDPTPSGDISGHGFVGTTGLFSNIIAGTGSSGVDDLSIYGDALFENNLIIGGTIVFPGLFEASGDFSSLDLSVSGEALVNQGISVLGGQSLFQDVEILENLKADQLSVSDILYADENILSSAGLSLNMQDDEIKFLSGQHSYIKINESGINLKDDIRVSGNNFFNLSNELPSGDLYVRGDIYSETIHALNSGTYRKFYPGDDESMVFKSRLLSGAKEFVVSLPKTFHDNPIINVNLQHISGEFIIPYLISDSTTYEYKIKFGTNINDDNFNLHTTVMSPSSGEFSSNKKGFQRFKTALPSGVSSQLISFPNPHQVNPTVSICLEGNEEIIPYTISGVNKDNYHIILGTETSEDYVIHTISTEEYNQSTS